MSEPEACGPQELNWLDADLAEFPVFPAYRFPMSNLSISLRAFPASGLS
jgi:hypothetical protein